jgi:hypothetical protein
MTMSGDAVPGLQEDAAQSIHRLPPRASRTLGRHRRLIRVDLAGLAQW